MTEHSIADYLAGFESASRQWLAESASLKKKPEHELSSAGYVYYLHLKDDIVKIGFVHKYERLVPRWGEISAEYGYKVHPVSVTGGGFFREQYLHLKHREFRRIEKGERFNLSSSLKDEIDHFRFSPLVQSAVTEWYGEDFLEPVLHAVMPNNSESKNKVKGLRISSRSLGPIDTEATDSGISVLATPELASMSSRVVGYCKDYSTWVMDLKSYKRPVWDMEFEDYA